MTLRVIDLVPYWTEDDGFQAEIEVESSCDCGKTEEITAVVPIVKKLHFLCTACHNEIGIVTLDLN